MQVYVAGPHVFTPKGKQFVRDWIVPPIEAAGYDCLYSADADDEANDADGNATGETPATAGTGEQSTTLNRWGMDIGEKNVREIDRADVMVANLDGADPDSGTSAEIGYAYGTNTPVVGYRTDHRSAGENEGVVVNLQVEYFLKDSGGSVIVPQQYGGGCDADHHRTYGSLDELGERLVDALDRLR